MNAGPEIATYVSESSGKLTLTCNMSAPHPTITGHKWMRENKTLQQDEDTSPITTYT